MGRAPPGWRGAGRRRDGDHLAGRGPRPCRCAEPSPLDAAGALARLRERIAPALEALLAAALDREQLQSEVVETRALRRSDEIKTAVLRSVSHDLRSPLTAILTSAEAVGSPSLTAEEREGLGRAIGEEAARLSRLVDKLLDMSRLQGGEAEPRRTGARSRRRLRAALDELSASEGEFKVTLDRDLTRSSRRTPRSWSGPSRTSWRTPAAIRAGSRAGAGRVVGGRLGMRIIDRGRASPHQICSGSSSRSTGGRIPAEHKGSGLGLAIARGFIEANGGRLWAESQPGQGTSFAIEFPSTACPPSRSAHPPPRAAHDRAGAARARLRRRAPDPPCSEGRAQERRVRGRGRGDGDRGAGCGGRAPPGRRDRRPVLPDGDGVEVCERLRSWSEMPILVLSAVGEEEQKVRALEAGADDIRHQALGARELVARLNAALRRAGRGGDEPTIAVDGLELDLAARVVRREGQEVHLTRSSTPPADARPQPRAPAHASHPVGRGVGAGLRGGHPGPRTHILTSRTCGARSSPTAPRRATSGPTRGRIPLRGLAGTSLVAVALNTATTVLPGASSSDRAAVAVSSADSGCGAASATRTRLPTGVSVSTRALRRLRADPCGASPAGSSAISHG